ncbi:hypothetical protein [Paraburkholderia kirstenboschensis]|uniref:Uncharacterized protein n=1 Tax=Paraburkholderia kirstenboschensis TaxID=1245436 RepID=A0ABZ0EI97_9BURK|nr:hypothetical protein [Paraburkholderia kirstenboschensis]WOD15952.1 hypothetical protein RW095_22245 [Paraburkholderia kirstenboschensis]
MDTPNHIIRAGLFQRVQHNTFVINLKRAEIERIEQEIVDLENKVKAGETALKEFNENA